MKTYERVKERTLEEWVYFFTDPKIEEMPENARRRACDAIEATLTERQKYIFIRRYQDKATLETIAMELGLSKPRIHNILEVAAVRLWESDMASVILREGKEAGDRYQEEMQEKRNGYYFALEIVEGLRNDAGKIIDLACSKKRKNVTTRLSRELGLLTVGEVVTFSKTQMDNLYGIGDKSKEFLVQLIEEYYQAKQEEMCHG